MTKYNIAIIDDDKVQRDYLFKILNSWKSFNKLNIKMLSNAESFCLIMIIT